MAKEEPKLWTGGQWEHPETPFILPPKVTIPVAHPPIFRKKRRITEKKKALFLFLVTILLVLGISVGSFITHYLLPLEGTGEHEISLLYEDEDPFGKIEQAEIGTGVTLAISVNNENDLSTSEIYKKCVPSIVSIQSVGEEGISTGTGILMTEDGYLITNAHVVSGAYSVEVMLQNDRIYDAKLVGADADEDLAVLKIEAYNLTPAEFGDSDLLECGDMVAAIGDPLGYRTSITEGIVSALDRTVDVDGVSMRLIQTSAPINFGNSGGALINEKGQIVGVTTVKIISEDGSIDGLGFAIPMNNVKSVVDWLIAGKPTLGITVEQRASEKRGLVVIQVEKQATAYQAGIRTGDILCSFQGQEVTTIDQLKAARAGVSVGETVTVEVIQNNQKQEISFVMQSQTEIAA